MLSLTNIGWIYRNGWGMARDYAEAMGWFRKTAGQGYAAAQSQLAHLAHCLAFIRGWPRTTEV